MRIRILGTAASEGWPALFCSCEACERARAAGGKNIRTRSATLIDEGLMIDFSADVFLNSLRFGIKLSRVHSVFITHDHEDHFNPSDFHYRCGEFAYLGEDDPPILTVYGNDRVGDKLAAYMNKAATKPQRLAFCPIRPFESMEIAGGYRVSALPALHDRAQQCCIYLVEDAGGKRMLYGHDTGIFPEEAFRALSGTRLDFVMLDCNAGPGRDGKNHMGFADGLIVRDKLRHAGCVSEDTRFVVTHFSHNGKLLHEELEAMAGPEGFSVAYDGAAYEV